MPDRKLKESSPPGQKTPTPHKKQDLLKPTPYFPGFNGLRAIAALIVMVFHTDQLSTYFGVAPYGFYKTGMQSFAVILFFVLSGFLITALLVQERKQQHRINLRNFYLRRILRTWPLYFAVLAIGGLLLWLLPAELFKRPLPDLSVTLALYALLVPNIATFFGFAPPMLNVLWSIGVEEQFYAFWPLLIRKAANITERITWFLFAWIALKYLAAWLHFPARGASILWYLPFDYLAIGGIAAMWHLNGSPVLKWVYHPAVQAGAWLFFGVSVFYQPVHIAWLGLLNDDLHAFMYAIILLNVGTNPRTLLGLEHRVLYFLGKISYGIYAFHCIVIVLLSVWLNNQLAFWPPLWAHGFIFTAVTVCTIGLAWLSWRFYESWFLKRKARYRGLRRQVL